MSRLDFNLTEFQSLCSPSSEPMDKMLLSRSGLTLFQHEPGSVPEALGKASSEFTVPSLGGRQFQHLVTDMQSNSRLPVLGQELMVAEQLRVGPEEDEMPLSRSNFDVPLYSGPSFLSHFKWGEGGGRKDIDLRLDIVSRHGGDTPLVSKATSCEILPSAVERITPDTIFTTHEAQREQMEKTLVMDLLLIFHGCNGTILQFNDKNFFAFYTDEKNLHPAQKTVALRMCPIGVCYKLIKAQLFVPTRGKCFEALKHWFQAQLRDFDLMVLTLEQMMLGRATDEQLEKYRKIVSFDSDGISLHQLECLFFDSKKILKAMVSMLSHVKSSITGAQLCSVLHEFTHHGDPDIQEFAYRTLSYVARPIYKMIGSWIFIGTVHDKQNDFFIKVDPQCSAENMWRGKFSLKTDNIPAFISSAEAKTIFRAGKNLNFLQEVCQTKEAFQDKTRLFQMYKDISIENTLRGSDSLFSDIIKTACTVTSDLVLKEIISNEKLFDNLHTIKYYILQGQGDFFQLFVQRAKEKLMKPIMSVNMQDLHETLQLAIVGATHVPSKDYISRIFVNTAPRSETLLVWDVLSLEYKTSQCLRQIITAESMAVYSRIFAFLWQSLRVESILKAMWVERKMFDRKVLGTVPEILTITFQNNVLISEFNNFVTQVRYYAMSEAVETEWQKLLESLLEVTCLEDMITAHDYFIKVLNIRCLQTRSAHKILLLLESVYNNIFKMEKYHTEFCERVSREFSRRNELALNNSDNSAQMNELIRRDFLKYLEEAQTTISDLQSSSRALIQDFLLSAENYVDNVCSGINLSGLCFRVDFSNFYTDRSTSLKEAKTLKHRLSEMNLRPPTGTQGSSSTVASDLSSVIASEDFI